jgi:hypothetical protein
MKLDQICFWYEIKLEIMKIISILFGRQKLEVEILRGKRERNI